MPGISNYPSAIRGTTKVAPWLLFDQRKQMNLVRLTPIAAPGIPGGRAETIVIPRRETQAYFIGASMRNQRPIARGDNIVAEIWLRAEATANANQPVVIEARIQEDGNGYRNLTTSQLSLTSSFTKFEVRARADQNFCPEELNFALHLATGHQTIDIGPATLKVIP